MVKPGQGEYRKEGREIRMDTASKRESWNILELGSSVIKVEILPGVAEEGQRKARKPMEKLVAIHVDCDLGKWEVREWSEWSILM